MLIRRGSDIPSSEITSETLYRNRREFLKTASMALAASAAAAVIPGCAKSSATQPEAAADHTPAAPLGPFDTNEKQTPYKDVTSYNNYYEFGTDKGDPVENAQKFRTQPWKIQVDGMVKQPAAYDLDDLLKGFAAEDRIYRMRCVEGWSMVIPWRGIPFSQVVNRLEPLPSAKYVEFKTILAPDQMPGQREDILDWPYTEGLRMDEAMNPLTLMVTGIYGKPVPNQNGAPVRMVMPWKYGFKGVKAIVNIRFTDIPPVTAWMSAAPNEYGFYANVNPNVDHPRWSQATERRIGELLKRKTLMFNGYSDQVAQMYSGMDLKKYF